MLVLVSFVLVLAAAVTLVVGLLQSGLTLIYLSIGCSVLAGVVLAVAVLRGRPEPRAAAPARAYSPTPRPQVPVSVGAPSSTETTTSWDSPSAAPAPPPPPPPPTSAPAPAGDDLATRAAGSALLGRLRGRRGEQEAEPAGATAPAPAPVADATTQIPAVEVPAPAEGGDGFPIADYDRLRATELLSALPALDRNQLEAVRDRESAGKNRFTIMSRVDALIATKEAPAWDAADDSWDDEGDSGAAPMAVGVMVDDDDVEAAFGADDEVDELVSSSAGDFPIAGYDTLTVGQILPRLSDLDGDELAQVAARERAGRNRGTILDRVGRLSARAAASGAAARETPTGRGRPRRVAAPAPAPAAKKARTPRAATAAPIAMPAAPAPAPAKAAPRKTAARKVAPAPAPAARKTAARKAPAAAAAPVAPTPMKEAVKKAQAAKKVPTVTKVTKATKAAKKR